MPTNQGGTLGNAAGLFSPEADFWRAQRSASPKAFNQRLSWQRAPCRTGEETETREMPGLATTAVETLCSNPSRLSTASSRFLLGLNVILSCFGDSGPFRVTPWHHLCSGS